MDERGSCTGAESTTRQMTKTAIVILNWNGLALLKQFLPSVLRYSVGEQVEIVIADNASTDDSVGFLAKNYSQIRCIQLTQNYGYAEGYNQALKQIEAEYFVLLNSDVEVTRDWLKPVIAYLDKNTDIVAAQPKIRGQRQRACFEYAGASGGFIDVYGYPFCRGRIFGEVEEDMGQYNTVIDVFWASGACLFIRSADFFAVGGFDASFFAHMEEIDLCWRLNARGKKIVCLPFSTVYHLGGGTLAEESSHKTFLNFRNNLLMLYKNLPEDQLKKILRIRLLLDYLAFFKFLISGRTSNAKAVFKAHREFSKMKREYDVARAENLAKTIHSIPDTIYSKSVLVEFFLKRVKHYSKLSGKTE